MARPCSVFTAAIGDAADAAVATNSESRQMAKIWRNSEGEEATMASPLDCDQTRTRLGSAGSIVTLRIQHGRILCEPTRGIFSFAAALRLVTDQVEDSGKAPATGDHNRAKRSRRCQAPTQATVNVGNGLSSVMRDGWQQLRSPQHSFASPQLEYGAAVSNTMARGGNAG